MTGCTAVNCRRFLEACGVTIPLCGTMGAGEATRVVQFLEEKGLLEG
ncbi:MAG: hypothetical protein LJE94_17185 [Deltaproteobacteria bacterium]|nr:hypothetical protein [Deltaproteobacteria bacterium]